MAFRTESLADRIFAKLEDDIILGVYPRGEVITEMRLAEELGVSRTPIREALRRLEQERLIEESGKGSVVRGISPEDVMDIMDVRIRVEPLASYYAALNVTPEKITELKNILELQEFYAAKHDAEHMRQEDEDFHDVICNLCGRKVIYDTLKPLHKKTRLYRRISVESFPRQSVSVQEHWAIFNAIAAGDAKLAEQLTTQHLEKAKKSMIERLESHG